LDVVTHQDHMSVPVQPVTRYLATDAPASILTNAKIQRDIASVHRNVLTPGAAMNVYVTMVTGTTQDNAWI
jgi:hypothetical protein